MIFREYFNEELQEDDVEETNTKATEDDDDEEESTSSTRASTIVKVIRLERAVKSINERLDELDPADNEESHTNLNAEIQRLNNEILALKEKVAASKDTVSEQVDNSPLIARIEALENAKPQENNEDSSANDVTVDVGALTLRIEKLEKTMQIVKEKHVPGAGAQIASFACKMSYLAILLVGAAFAIKGYLFVQNKNTSDADAVDAAIKMGKATDTVMMYFACFAAVTGLFCLIGLFVGKGKRGSAFMGFIFSAIACFAYIAIKFMGVLEIK